MMLQVYTGLIKMYRAEVLSKFPIIQHTYFGSIFTLKPAKSQTASRIAAAGPRRRVGPGQGYSSSGLGFALKDFCSVI